MKAKDLMVGDWVYNKHHKKNIQITPYDFFTHGHLPSGRQYFIGEPELVSGRDLEPIPLTPEILEKNGWVKDLYSVESYDNEELEHLFLWVGEDGKNKWWWHVGVELVTPINYVHQLQHALLLCGIKKEIIL